MANVTYLRIRLYLEPTVTQMAFASERVYRCRVVVPNLLLLRVVPHTHANVVVACSALRHLSTVGTGLDKRNVPPDVER